MTVWDVAGAATDDDDTRNKCFTIGFAYNSLKIGVSFYENYMREESVSIAFNFRRKIVRLGTQGPPKTAKNRQIHIHWLLTHKTNIL